jgi:hypothetical protein
VSSCFTISPVPMWPALSRTRCAPHTWRCLTTPLACWVSPCYSVWSATTRKR